MQHRMMFQSVEQPTAPDSTEPTGPDFREPTAPDGTEPIGLDNARGPTAPDSMGLNPTEPPAYDTYKAHEPPENDYGEVQPDPIDIPANRFRADTLTPAQLKVLHKYMF